MTAIKVVVHRPGELKQRIPERIVSAIRKLKVEGILSSEDVRFLKKLASRTTLKDTLGNRLEPFFDLDLADATIPMSSSGDRNEASRIPVDFMRGSTILKKIVLPINTEQIENEAFANSNKLREIHIPIGIRTIGKETLYDCTNL